MRVLLINSVCGIGSTGKICVDIADDFAKNGHEVKIAYGRDSYVPEKYKKYAVRIGNDLDVKKHGIRTRVLGDHGLGSRSATRKFLKWADEYKPDLLWLHNIHGYYINYEELFAWIKMQHRMKVKWTLHDCWAFTGHCVHFSAIGCKQWKQECTVCMQRKRYPSTLFKGNVLDNYRRKKKAFSDVENLTIITPSKWLANLVKESFLGQYPVEVQYNSVDKNIFKPIQSDFRAKKSLENRKIILGVANAWDDRKGLYDFFELSDMLDPEYVVVLVGLTKEQLKGLPDRIIGIERTKNIEELVEIYSAADVYVNPSREETFGMTTVEAMYCGTPAIVYRGTACEEIAEQMGGTAVALGVENIYKAICELVR